MLPAAISGDALLRSEGSRDDLLQRAISRDCRTPRISLECADFYRGSPEMLCCIAVL
jgi:hypothetical protein